MRLFRPRVFISYAREDGALASALRDALTARGFAVFFDSDAMLAGEDFVRRIREELKRSDAVVALYTPASIASEWCNAEWYFAHARGVPVIPVRFGEVQDALPAPVKLLEERIHYLQPSDLTELRRVGGELARQLDDVRRRRRLRVLLGAAATMAGIALLAGAAYVVWTRVETFVRGRERAALVARLTAAKEPLPGDAIQRDAARFAGDEVLLGAAMRLASDQRESDAARLNGWMLATELLRRKHSEGRWYLKNVAWSDGIIDGGRIADVTFMSGSVQKLHVRNATLAAVYWGRAPNLTLSNARFDNVKFTGGAFGGTNAVDVKFTDCVFRGVEVDVTAFALVTFATTPPDPRHPNLVTPNVAAFENSVILNQAPPPEPGVLDLSEPKDEVQFRDVIFDGVRFRGRMRPEWFERCSFDRCTFPKTLSAELLEQRGNRVTNSQWVDEP